MNSWFIAFLCSFVFFEVVETRDGGWPNPAALRGFWLMDNETRFVDKAGFTDLQESQAVIFQNSGPFDLPGSAMTVEIDGGFLSSSKQSSFTISSEFTISFFYYPGLTLSTGGLMSFTPTSGSIFAMANSNLDLQINAPTSSSTSTNIVFSRAFVRAFWNFVALTYSNGSLKLWNRYGESISNKTVTISATQSYQLYIGRGLSEIWGFKSQDAMACVSYYSESLKSHEIAKLYDACKRKGQKNQKLGNWPDPENLFAFWPLTKDDALQDATGRHSLIDDASLLYSSKGPFGKIQTSYRVSNSDKMIGYTYDYDAPLASSFTLSFYIYIIGTTASSGIINFWSYSDSKTVFTLSYNSETLHVWNGLSSILKVDFTYFAKNYAWNFIALTYKDGTISLHDELGNVVKSSPITLLTNRNRNRIRIGNTNYGERDIGLNENDALACVMYYETALHKADIAKLPAACQTRGFVRDEEPAHNWPSSDKLFAFWPLDAESDMTDVANDYKLTKYGGIPWNQPGPFGEPYTSYTTSQEPLYIGYSVWEIELPSDFTISLYFYRSKDSTKGGIVSINSNYPAFAVSYQNNDLIVWGGVSHDVKVATFQSVLKAGQWNFIAITHASNALRLYDENGRLVGYTPKISALPTSASYKIYIGRAFYGSSSDIMHVGDAMACVMYFKTNLEPDQIAALRETCRTKGNFLAGWPRDEFLELFYPFDEQNQMFNIKSKESLTKSQGEVSKTLVGPFGQPKSSFSPYIYGAIGFTSGYATPFTESFTLSFYFYTGVVIEGGIFSMKRSDDTVAMSISYGPTNKLKIQLGRFDVHFVHDMEPNQWNFFAITFAEGVLSIYNSEGQLLSSKSDINVDTVVGGASYRHFVGIVQNFFEAFEMRTDDAIACLSYWTNSLTATDIRLLPKMCETKGGTYNASTTLDPSLTSATPKPSNWPQRANLYGFWPLDQQNYLSDTENGNHLAAQSAKVYPLLGPFGDTNSALMVDIENQMLAYSHEPNVPLASQFSVNFYVFTQANSQQGLFMIWNEMASNGFSIGYSAPGNLEIWVQDGVRIASFSNLLTAAQWNFVSVVYAYDVFTVYNENGRKLASTRSTKLPLQTTTNRLYVGRANFANFKGLMKTDALACLSYYTAALSSNEIAMLPYLCQTKGYGSTIPPITTSLPTEPWPRNSALVGFWPMDAQNKLLDLSSNKNYLSAVSGVLSQTIDGPFDEPQSSYTVSSSGNYIANSAFFYIQFKTECSVSLFINTRLEAVGGLILFYKTSYVGWSLGYNAPNLLELYGNYGLLATFPILKPDTWNFIAVTFAANKFQIFNENGEVVGTKGVSTTDMPYNATNVMTYAGYTKKTGSTSYNGMKTTDHMACLMYYSAELTGSEIARLPDVCRRKGQLPKTTVQTTPVPEGSTTWPRPNSLLGLWPLDAAKKTSDISQHRWPSTNSSYKLTTGPHGTTDTAVTPSSDQRPLFMVENEYFSLTKSFTISFFLRVDSTTGGIFEFSDKTASDNAIQIRYVDRTYLELAANNAVIGRYQIVQQKQSWTFVSFVYDGTASKLSVYTRHGLAFESGNQDKLAASMIYNNNGIKVGFASKWNSGLAENDALSCLSVYSEALSWREIKQLQQACRSLHGSASCGNPKLPLPQIPEATVNTAIPSAGQFPFVASLQSGDSICSATIIDQFWLLTAKVCFNASNVNAKAWTVVVGEHDLKVTEAYQRNHKVNQIIVADIFALVEVEDPIDFSNPYVNDNCLFEEDLIDEIKFDASQFVFGWGQNGRQPLVSQSLPRYVPGSMLTEKQCVNVWGDDFDGQRDVCFLSASTDKNVPCMGDEGSPLLLQARENDVGSVPKRLVQLGIYYKRDAGCTVAKPGLFANINSLAISIYSKIACAVPGFVYPATCPAN